MIFLLPALMQACLSGQAVKQKAIHQTINSSSTKKTNPTNFSFEKYFLGQAKIKTSKVDSTGPQGHAVFNKVINETHKITGAKLAENVDLNKKTAEVHFCWAYIPPYSGLGESFFRKIATVSGMVTLGSVASYMFDNSSKSYPTLFQVGVFSAGFAVMTVSSHILDEQSKRKERCLSDISSGKMLLADYIKLNQSCAYLDSQCLDEGNDNT